MTNPPRKDHEPPPAVARSGWRYHHLGIPTSQRRPAERYLEQFRFWVSGFDTSPYGIEWMRFEPECSLPAAIQSQPHIAFEVDDLDAALEGKEVLCSPGSPSAGVRAAMIVDDGALIELIEFRK